MTSDEQQNLPATTQPAEAVSVQPMAVAEFEGEYVRHMFAKLPGVTLPMDAGYPRGAHLKMEMEVRVRSVVVDEMKGKNAGELARTHHFALEDIRIVGVYTAEQMDPGVGGSAAATGNDVEDEETDESPEQETDDGVGF